MTRAWAPLVVILALLSAAPLLWGCERRSRSETKSIDLSPPPPMPTAPAPDAPELAASAASSSTAAPAPLPLARERGGRAPVACARDTKFPDYFDLAEASAAAEVEIVPGKRELILVSDSGNKGAALLWPIGGGAVRTIALALDGTASDDIEGISWARDAAKVGHLYTLTSSGAVRRFTADGKGGLVRDHDAYRLGPPPATCVALQSANCGRNYEGLCLRSKRARCAGYAASKDKSTLHCLVFESGRLVADPIKPPITLPLRARALSDCAFGAEGGPAEDVLVVTTNVYGNNASYIVDEATGELTPIDVPGTFNNEAIALDHTGALYQMMDTNGEVSPGFRMECSGW